MKKKLNKIIFVSVAIIITARTIALLKYRSLLQETEASLRQPQRHPDLDIRALLNTMPLPPKDRDHLLDGDFNLVTRTEEIPNDCLSTFNSSFTKLEGKVNLKEIELANPGQIFQMSDALIPDAPFRRLVF